jgi:hypothetical protein
MRALVEVGGQARAQGCSMQPHFLGQGSRALIRHDQSMRFVGRDQGRRRLDIPQPSARPLKARDRALQGGSRRRAGRVVVRPAENPDAQAGRLVAFERWLHAAQRCEQRLHVVDPRGKQADSVEARRERFRALDRQQPERRFETDDSTE